MTPAGVGARLWMELATLPIRAGGGHNSNPGHSFSHSSGGSSGGGSHTTFIGSGGGGSGGSIFGGILCLIILVIVIVIAVAASKKKGGGLGAGLSGSGVAAPPPPPPPPAPVTGRVDEVIGQIKQRDQAFDVDTFLNQASDAFYLVQKAWCDQQPAQSRKVMADGVWVRHKAQMEELGAANKTNVLEELSIGTSTIVDANTDADNDSLTVRFYAVCRDYDIDKDSKKIVRGDREMRGFQEDWVFQRSSKAITRPDGGTLSQKCPNCGAPLNLDNAGTCAYCKEMVMGGKHDWVLTRIEQVFS